MFNKLLTRWIFVLLLLGAISPPAPVGGQSGSGGLTQVRLPRPFGESTAPFIAKWDPFAPAVIFYADSGTSNSPSVVKIDTKGKIIFSANPAADLADRTVRGVSIWYAAPTPAGGLALSAIVHRGANKVSHVILLYDASAKLKKVWDVFPYHHHALAVDSGDNVYALGHQLSPPSGRYPMLIKYGPNGKVAKTLAWSDQFGFAQAGKDVLDVGLVEVQFRNDHLYVVVGAIQRLLVFDLATGQNVHDYDTRPLLTIARQKAQTAAVTIRSWTFDMDGVSVLEVGVLTQKKQLTGVQFFELKEGREIVALAEAAPRLGQFMGRIPSGHVAILADSKAEPQALRLLFAVPGKQ